MKKHVPSVGICSVCGQEKPLYRLLPASLVRTPVAELIGSNVPGWSEQSFICYDDLNRFRDLYIESVLTTGRGELTSLERDILDSMRSHELLSHDTETDFEKHLSLGDRLADRIAEFGGSWKFILSFIAILTVWILVNSFVLLRKPFDPYPYILLNLILSCLAALQAPVIMMSQNRQESKDRLRGIHDYKVNLKAELEIRHLHEKMDYLLLHQWQRLLEIQQIQIELMEELAARPEGQKHGQ